MFANRPKGKTRITTVVHQLNCGCWIQSDERSLTLSASLLSRKRWRCKQVYGFAFRRSNASPVGRPATNLHSIVLIVSNGAAPNAEAIAA
jgi:hypothetical protein